MQLWQHKKNTDIKFAAKPYDEDNVEIWAVRLTPDSDYHPPHLWAYSGLFPRDEFMKLYEPVNMGGTDKKTIEFWGEFAPRKGTGV